MPENQDSKFEWKKLVTNSLKKSFGLAGKAVVEAGKEEAVNLLEASKGVLNNHKNRAVDAFNYFPNKSEFAFASLMVVDGVLFHGMSVAAMTSKQSLFEPTAAIANAAGWSAAGLLFDTSAMILFKEWCAIKPKLVQKK